MQARWYRPLGGFTDPWLVIVQFIAFALSGLSYPFMAGERWLHLGVVLLLAFCFGMASGEILLRLRFPERGMIVPALSLPPGTDLPPPGLAVVTCATCGRQAMVPEGLASAASVAVCSHCMDS